MKRLITICVIFAICPTVANALVTIDFEAYSDYQNLHGVNLGGVTLTNPTNNLVEVIANNRWGNWYNSPVNAIGSPDPLGPSVNPIVGVFDVPVNYVSLWAGDDGGDNDQWQLNAYDAAVGGTQIGSATSDLWGGKPYWQLSISAPGIVRFEAIWLGPPYWGGITYDDLAFEREPIPAPGAILLGGIGVGLVGWLRRRKMI